MNFTIGPEHEKTRLDVFLTNQLGLTRSQIKKILKTGAALVNNKPASVHHFLKVGDEVSFTQDHVAVASSTTTKPTPQPTIIYETADILVINKPSGLLVHPTTKQETNTLVDWLVARYPQITDVGTNTYRAGIIHRLDRDVSGVLLVAKTPTAFDHLKEQFKQRSVKKEYTALVYGHVLDQTGEIDLPIGRRKDGQFVAHPRRAGDKLLASDQLALTRYRVIEYVKEYTLLRVMLITGRTHQIRVHLSAIGHPILGDTLYKPKRDIFKFLQRKLKVVSLPRIFLHATTIGFTDPAGQWQEFTAPLPEVLTTYLYELKK